MFAGISPDLPDANRKSRDWFAMGEATRKSPIRRLKLSMVKKHLHGIFSKARSHEPQPTHGADAIETPGAIAKSSKGTADRWAFLVKELGIEDCRNSNRAIPSPQSAAAEKTVPSNRASTAIFPGSRIFVTVALPVLTWWIA